MKPRTEASLHVAISQWTLVNGIRQPQSDLIAIHRPRASLVPPSREDPLWVVLAEVGGRSSHGHEAAALVVRALEDRLSMLRSPSVTSSVRRALRAAQETLEEHIRLQPASEQAQVGVTCALIYGAEVLAAQVQPAQAFLLHADKMQAWPVPPAWRAGAAGVYGMPDGPGMRPGVEPDWFRSALQPGDLLVLCSSNLAGTLTQEEMEQIMRQGDAAAVSKVLYHHVGGTKLLDAHAVVLNVLTGPAADEQVVPAVPASDLDAARPARATRRAPPRRSAVSQRTSLRTGRTRPYRQTRPVSVRRRRWMPPLWVSGLLILGVIAALIVIGVQQSRQRNLRIANQALDQAEQRIVAASNADDVQAAQRQLAAAEASLQNEIDPLIQSGLITETNRAVWSRYQQVLDRYDQARMTIYRIGFLDQLQTIASLPAQEGIIGQLVLGTTQADDADPPLFYLDSGNGRLYQQGRPETLLQPGMQIGTASVGQILEAVWRQDDIVAFDRGDTDASLYRAFLRSGDDWRIEALRRPDQPTETSARMPVAEFDGNIYVWDGTAQQIWRYDSGQFDQPPTPWITNAGQASLDQVVDIAIDGRIYLLQSDGSVLVLVGGQLVEEFAPPELEVPVATATRLVVTDPLVDEDGTVQRPGYLYMLDPRNERVLQIDKESGQLVQQIQARTRGPLNQLVALTVDEARQVLYLANGSDVLLAALPEPPQAGVEEAPASPEAPAVPQP